MTDARRQRLYAHFAVSDDSALYTAIVDHLNRLGQVIMTPPAESTLSYGPQQWGARFTCIEGASRYPNRQVWDSTHHDTLYRLMDELLTVKAEDETRARARKGMTQEQDKKLRSLTWYVAHYGVRFGLSREDSEQEALVTAFDRVNAYVNTLLAERDAEIERLQARLITPESTGDAS